MGTDRIIDLHFSLLPTADELLRSLDLCRRSFGFQGVESPLFSNNIGALSIYYLYRYEDPTDEWLTVRFTDIGSLVGALTVASPFKNWTATLSLMDSKRRFFCDVELVGVVPDFVRSFRLKMRRDTLLFGDRMKNPPDVDHLTCMSEKEKIEFVRKWERHEQELIELERQEYHFMRTLFDMLPQAVALDLYVADPDLDDPVSYRFTRAEGRATSHFKEKRLPEFEQWCDEHEPEYWQPFKPPMAT